MLFQLAPSFLTAQLRTTGLDLALNCLHVWRRFVSQQSCPTVFLTVAVQSMWS